MRVMKNRSCWSALLLLLCLAALPRTATAADEKAAANGFLCRQGDQIVWIGSSSTAIGTYCRAAEFLLRTRHPDLQLTFARVGKGGWTFAQAQPMMPEWLAQTKPTLVVFNFGANDANKGEKGLPAFYEAMTSCVDQSAAAGARVIVMIHQATDVRKSGERPVANRKLYAEKMLAYAAEKGWTTVDPYHPLDALQLGAQGEDPAFTLNKDTIHLTEAGYVAWGYFLYGGMNPPQRESAAVLTARGKVTSVTGCKITNLKARRNSLRFTRQDEILPILPPTALPPRQFVPLESLSRYLLQVTGLRAGRYDITCEGKPLGSADAAELAAGVNLNTLLLDSGNPAPWQDLAAQIWKGNALDQIGKTAWQFEVKRR